MPEIFEFIDISCRLFFFLLDQEKESKRNQDAAIPQLLAQFLSLHHPQPRSIIHRIIAVPRASLKLAHRYSASRSVMAYPMLKMKLT